MKILITICARGGSKGIIGKNIKLMNGKPLIAYTIDLANQIKEKYNAKVALSTDNQNIKDTAKILGITSSYNRPECLATDNAGKIETISDLLNFEEKLVSSKYDYIIDLDVSSPLRTFLDIESSLELLIKNPNAYNIFSVSKATKNPYFNMVEANPLGYYSLVKTNVDGNIFTRQSAPAVFELNASFYIYRRSFFESNFKTVITDKSLVYMMNHICFDLDHDLDFFFLEYLLKNKKLDFDI